MVKLYCEDCEQEVKKCHYCNKLLNDLDEEIYCLNRNWIKDRKTNKMIANMGNCNSLHYCNVCITETSISDLQD